MKENLLKRYGFNKGEFLYLQEEYREGRLSLRSNVINHDNPWEVRLPLPTDSTDFPSTRSEEYERGREIIAQGKLGLIFMNGGPPPGFRSRGRACPKEPSRSWKWRGVRAVSWN